MVEIRGLPKRTASLIALIIVAMSEPLIQMRVVMADHLEITPEHGMVCDIEPDDRREESDICFCDVFAEEEGAFVAGDVVLKSVEGCE